MISIADSLDQITPMAAAIGIGGLILFIILSSIQSSPSQGKRIPTAWFYDHGFSGIFSNMVPGKHAPYYSILQKYTSKSFINRSLHRPHCRLLHYSRKVRPRLPHPFLWRKHYMGGRLPQRPPSPQRRKRPSSSTLAHRHGQTHRP